MLTVSTNVFKCTYFLSFSKTKVTRMSSTPVIRSQWMFTAWQSLFGKCWHKDWTKWWILTPWGSIHVRHFFKVSLIGENLLTSTCLKASTLGSRVDGNFCACSGMEADPCQRPSATQLVRLFDLIKCSLHDGHFAIVHSPRERWSSQYLSRNQHHHRKWV